MVVQVVVALVVPLLLVVLAVLVLLDKVMLAVLVVTQVHLRSITVVLAVVRLLLGKVQQPVELARQVVLAVLERRQVLLVPL